MPLSRLATHPTLLLALAALLGALAYWPGLSGPFLFDDFQNIVLNPAVQPAQLDLDAITGAWQGNQSGPLGRPLASLSFAFNHRLGGLDPSGYKAVNLLLHLLAGAALFGMLRSLLHAAAMAGSLTGALADRHRREQVAALATALWLLAPLQASTVLYVVQRMTLLSALFSLLGLWAYVHGRGLQLQGRRGALWLWLAMPALTLAAALGKENGLLVPVLALVCEWTLLRFRAADPASQRALRGIWIGLAVTAALLALWTLPAWWSGLPGNYAGRPFTLEERLLTEARVLWYYLRLLLVPDLGAMFLHHDDFPKSLDWLTPASTLPAVAGLFAAAGAALLLPARAPLAAFAVLFYLAGHSLESGPIPLELVFEHRNYLPAAGWMLLLAALLLQLEERRPRLGFGLALALLAVYAGTLAVRSHTWGDEDRLVAHGLRHHPLSARTQLWAGDQARRRLAQIPDADQAARLRQQGIAHYREAARLDPAETVGLSEALLWQAGAGEPPDPAGVDELGRRYRQQPPTAATVNGAFALGGDVAEGRSRLPPGTVAHLLAQLLANPALGGSYRATILVGLADLDWISGRREQAWQGYRQAQALTPRDAYLWLHSAVMAMQLGRYDEAEACLAAARRHDGGELAAGLARLAADLAAARTAAPATAP